MGKLNEKEGDCKEGEMGKKKRKVTMRWLGEKVDR